MSPEVIRLRAMRDLFVERGDMSLVAEVDAQLHRLGVTPPAAAEAAVPPPANRAVPARPRRKGPR